MNDDAAPEDPAAPDSPGEPGSPGALGETLDPGGQPLYLSPPPPPRKRSRCLIACCLLLALLFGSCCLVPGWIQGRLSDPHLAEARMQAVVPSSVPAGYAGNFSLEVQGLLVAVLAPEGAVLPQGPFHIVAVAAAPHADRAVTLAQFREGIQQQFQLRVSEASDVEVTVRGAPVPAQQLRGTTAAGTPVKVVLLAIARRADDPDLGDAILIAGGPEADFDDAAWEAFLGSIR